MPAEGRLPPGMGTRKLSVMSDGPCPLSDHLGVGEAKQVQT